MYRQDVYRYGKNEKYIEHEYKTVGRYGAKGEKRAPRKKATPEQIEKQNQRNREKKVLRKMRCNFEPGDLWITLKLQKGARLPVEDIKKYKEGFLRGLRGIYKKRKQPCKYMYRLEIGERGGIHMHILLNRLDGAPGTAEIVQAVWGRITGGHVYYTPAYEEGGFRELAAYLIKENTAEISGQLTLFGNEEECQTFSRYGCSRNLTEPHPEVHEYKRRTIRKLVENGPEPQPGYYIDRDSIRYGVNPYNGMTYYYYTEIRLNPARGRKEEKG